MLPYLLIPSKTFTESFIQIHLLFINEHHFSTAYGQYMYLFYREMPLPPPPPSVGRRQLPPEVSEKISVLVYLL